MAKSKEKILKENIIKLLKTKDNWEDIDETMIDELLFNFYLAYQAKKDIKKNGVMVNVVRAEGKEPLYQANQSVGVYHQALKYATSLMTKLGINPLERKKLKISGGKLNDIFDEIDNE